MVVNLLIRNLPALKADRGRRLFLFCFFIFLLQSARASRHASWDGKRVAIVFQQESSAKVLLHTGLLPHTFSGIMMMGGAFLGSTEAGKGQAGGRSLKGMRAANPGGKRWE